MQRLGPDFFGDVQVASFGAAVVGVGSTVCITVMMYRRVSGVEGGKRPGCMDT